MILSSEVGESGTPHFQGFVHFKNAKTLTACKKWLGTNRVHLEPTQGTDFEAWMYCTPEYEGKDDDTCTILMTLGEVPLEEGDSSAWDVIVRMIQDGQNNLEIVKRYPQQAVRCQSAIDRYRLEWDRANAEWRDLEVTYLHGLTGVGKTRMVMEKYGYSNVHRCTDKKHPFETYNGQDVLVFEEFRSSYKIEDMLNWLDGYPVELPARYANKLAKFTKVYIISNWQLDEQYPNQQLMHPRTWKAFQRRIHNITKLEE